MLRKIRVSTSFRLHVFFFIIFLLFALLVIRLGMLQITNGEKYAKAARQEKDQIVEAPVPRGKIFDRSGRPIVLNKPVNAITYTRSYGVSQQQRLDIAKRLAPLMSKDISKVTERDMKDYWLLTRPEQAKRKLTEKELFTLEDEELYQFQLNRITKEDLSTISGDELEVIAIKRELDRASLLTEHTIDRNEVSNREIALVTANEAELPGVSTKVDWDRTYPNQDSLRSLFGNITDPNEGLPSAQLPYYLSLGYNRNDRVGTSFLEKQYEDILQGEKQKILFKYNLDGDILSSEPIEQTGKQKDLILTIDMNLQKQVERIIEKEIIKAKEQFPKLNKNLSSAYVVMMNPKTGELLALAGKTLKAGSKNTFYDAAIGNVLYAYPVGSAVKAATVLTGLQTGAIKPGTVFLDEPIKIKHTPLKKSYKNLGQVNDLQAIQRSSNVYMWKLAMKLGQYNYAYNQAAEFKNPQAFDTMRYYFSQFGLGVPTGIDLPYEATGYTGSGRKIGFLMDFAIGQYDTYTPLQLAQYMATIANNGYRMRPHLLKDIRVAQDQDVNKIVYQANPEPLNQVDIKRAFIQRVQQGLLKVTNEPGGTAYRFFNDYPIKVAAKTGTAEAGNRFNLTLAGYAPYDNPAIAFAVVVPNVSDQYSINNYIGKQILDAYFNSKKK